MTFPLPFFLIAVLRPGTGWDGANVNEFPIAGVQPPQTQIIAHSRRNIQSRVMVTICSGAFVTKNIFPVFGSERSDVLPLRIADSVSMADCYPAAFAYGLAVSNEGGFEPGNHPRGFRSGVMVLDIIVGQCDIKRVLPRRETERDKIPPSTRVRVIVASVAGEPSNIPGALLVRNRVIDSRFLTNPKDSCGDAELPLGLASRRGAIKRGHRVGGVCSQREFGRNLPPLYFAPLISISIEGGSTVDLLLTRTIRHRADKAAGV